MKYIYLAPLYARATEALAHSTQLPAPGVEPRPIAHKSDSLARDHMVDHMLD